MKDIITAITLLLLSADISYAEVMDKEPSLIQNFIYGISGAALIVLVARLKPWLLLVVVPFPLLYFASVIVEIQDLHVGPAILNEAGGFYIISAYALMILLIVSVIAGLIIHRKKVKHNDSLHRIAGKGPGSR